MEQNGWGRIGTSIYYKKNGVIEYVRPTTGNDALGGDVSLRTPGSSLSGFQLVSIEANIHRPMQRIDFAYNVRGWLKGINDPDSLGTDLFGFAINYNDPLSGAVPLYNGNISETHWNTQSVNSTQNPVSNQYLYSYDALNRITGATDNTGNYNLSFVNYDKNGNITGLSRNGWQNTTNFSNMDVLGYDYMGNRLTKVSDAGNGTYGFKDGASTADEYTYDANGNMITDANKGITNISYNYLNMPTEVKFNSSNSQKINYIYSSDGVKLRKVTNDNGNITTTEYAGNYIYENGSLKFFGTPNGYVEPVDANDLSKGFGYVFQYKDHLGNIRFSYSDFDLNGTINPSTEILNEKNYYPFGLEHKGYNSSVVGLENNYKTFQGQELDKELGLNWYHFKFRTYDASIGRFLQIDPLAPTYVYNSTYAFAENNVTSGIDLEGLELSFELDGNRATAVSGPVRGTLTLQEVRSEISKKKTQREALMNRIDALPAALSNQATIDYPTTNINRAKYLYPQSGLMIANGVGIGAKEAVTDIALGGALNYLFRGAKALGSVWDLNRFARGRVIENILGANKAGWASNFPVIDKIENSVAISIKSLDLNAKSYQKGNTLFNTLKGYINKLDDFTGANWGNIAVGEADYTSKALELAVQTGKGSESQWAQISNAINYALEKNINVTIRFID